MDELFIYFATPPSVFLLGIFLISRRLIHQITEKDEYLQQPENHRAGNRRMRPFSRQQKRKPTYGRLPGILVMKYLSFYNTLPFAFPSGSTPPFS